MKRILILILITIIPPLNTFGIIIKKHSTSINGSFLISPTTLNGSYFNMRFSYGKYIADNLRMSGKIFFSDDDIRSEYGIGVALEKSFDVSEKLLPYIRGSAHISLIDFDKYDTETATIISFSPGTKYFLSGNNLYIFSEINFSYATKDIYYNKNEREDTDVIIRGGFGYIF